MPEPAAVPLFVVEAIGESDGHCDCCGNQSRCVWGVVHRADGPTVAAYWMKWTVNHLAELGANLDLVIGRWGDDASSDDRLLVSLRHRIQADGRPAVMVVDATDNHADFSDLACSGLARSDVIGTPLAEQVFALVDAIYEQDGRLF